MPIKLRSYQQELKDKVYAEWMNGYRAVLAKAPTGSGKTKTFTTIIKDFVHWNEPSIVQVHRKELVSQISMTLAEEEIYHNIIAPRNVILEIISQHRAEFNRHFYKQNSIATIASVDTLNAREKTYKDWAKGIKRIVVDEAAHVLKANKWGKAVSMFPEDSLILGVTATPERLDKRGLGKHADGIFEVMVEAPDTRWMIKEGYLCNYRVAWPKSDYNNYLRKASNNSDYSRESLEDAANRSAIVGDVVKEYMKLAMGKQTIVFAPSINSGMKMQQEFLSNNIGAKMLSSDTPDAERIKAMRDFRSGVLKVLINVDLFDEGLDIPGVEVVVLARPTMSLNKYLQMVGRVLRPVYASGYDLSTKEGRIAAQAAGSKPFAIIIDHVGNSKGDAHGLPDQFRTWTLDRIIRRREKVNLTKICENPQCNAPYDRLQPQCPYCGFEPKRRSSAGGERIPLKEIDGDLILLTPEEIRQLQGMAQLEAPGDVAARVGAAAGPAAAQKALKAQQERIKCQSDLAKKIASWAGRKRDRGLSDRQINKLFYLTYDMTITMAMSEPAAYMKWLGEELESEYI